MRYTWEHIRGQVRWGAYWLPSLRGLEGMRPFRISAVAVALALATQSAVAFQETTVGGGEQQAPSAPALEMPKASVDDPKGLNLSGSELTLGRTPGTEVRIPGLGSVGVLPKLDFGLELLYGANEPKGPQPDKTDDDVQIRGTIKHRF